MNKQAIELSINFLVGFILAITLFGLGIGLLYTIFGQATDLNEITQNQIDEQVSELLCNARERVCISGNREAHKSGDPAILGVFIYNNFDITTKYTLAVIDPGSSDGDGISQHIDQNKNTIPFSEAQDYVRPITNLYDFTIGPNDQDWTGIGFTTSKRAKKGTYVFDLFVAPENTPLNQGIKRKIYIRIE